MSHEHRALGFRPPPGSLAAEAQSAAAKHPDGDGTHLDDDTLREIALRDAERIKADRELNMVGEVNVSSVGKGTSISEFLPSYQEALNMSPAPFRSSGGHPICRDPGPGSSTPVGHSRGGGAERRGQAPRGRLVQA